MGDKFFEVFIVFLGMIGTVAVVSVIVGQHAQSAGVLSAGGSALAQDLQAAEAPVL